MHPITASFLAEQQLEERSGVAARCTRRIPNFADKYLARPNIVYPGSAPCGG